MARFVVVRLLWAVIALLGITAVTFVLVDVAPGDPALVALESGEAPASAAARAEALHRLRIRFGQIDPATGRSLTIGERYLAWLRHAATLEFAAASDDPDGFRRRLATALPVSLLLGTCALILALAVAVPLGAYLGLRRGGIVDRTVGVGLLLLWGMPEFLLATLLVVFCGGSTGLQGELPADASLVARLADLAVHLVLPVLTLAIGPTVWIARVLRESVARAGASDFALALRGWGMDPRTIRARVLRNGLSPLVTLVGVLLPLLVSGSVVVESVFALPGLGELAFRAVRAREVPMVMALTVLVSVVTLAGMVASDLLHRWVDPRVSLTAKAGR